MLWNPPKRQGSGDGRVIRRRMALWRLPVGGFASLARAQLKSRPDLFFNRKLGLQRSGRGLKVPLADIKALKDQYGCTVNDAVLGLIGEGLHRWFVDRGTRVAAEKLTGLAGWAPPTLLILAGRVMPNQQGGANINVTNVPGPQFPLYAGGAQMLEVWPFAPLYPSMGLGIAVVSYNGNLYLGFSADSTLVPDVESFWTHIRAAAEECSALAGSASGG